MDTISWGALNIIDIGILVIFVVSILIGLGRGLVSEVLSLLIVIASFVVAILFTNQLATYFASTATMQNVVNSTSNAAGTSTAEPLSYMALAISFAILFIATVIVGSVIKMLLNLMFRGGILGFGNRLL